MSVSMPLPVSDDRYTASPNTFFDFTRVRPHLEIRFVDDGGFIFDRRRDFQNFKVIAAQFFAAVKHGDDELRAPRRVIGARDAEFFGRIVGLPDTGGVDKAQHNAAQADFFLDRVPRCPGKRRDDRPFITEQGV